MLMGDLLRIEGIDALSIELRLALFGLTQKVISVFFENNFSA
jgi:hypothetical protein